MQGRPSVLLALYSLHPLSLSLLCCHTCRDPLSTWCEFVPQMVFLNSLFGYLSFLILQKWATGESRLQGGGGGLQGGEVGAASAGRSRGRLQLGSGCS